MPPRPQFQSTGSSYRKTWHLLHGAIGMEQYPGRTVEAGPPHSHRTPAPLPPRPSQPTGAILCVDDEPKILELLQKVLRRAMAPTTEILGATSAEEAIAQITRLLAAGGDLVALLTDERMPGMSGEDLIARTRSLSPMTPAILMTGHASPDLLGRVMNRSGLFRYIAKPCQPAQIISAARDAQRAFFQQKEFRRIESLIRKAAHSDATPHEITRILRRQEALLELSFASARNFEARLFTILERTAEVLRADRVCLIEYSADKGSFHCDHLFDRRASAHLRPKSTLPASGYPAYTAAIAKGQVVIARGPEHPPAPSHHAPQFSPATATASIDAPVWQSGRLTGVVRCEVSAGARDWAQEDAYFAMLAAHMVGAAWDSDQRQRAEARLREAEERYRAIFENAVVGIYQSTDDGRFLACNPAMASLLGFDSPAALKDTITDIAREIYAEPGTREALVARLLDTGNVVDFESALRRRDGSIVFVSESARVVCDESGGVAYMEGIVKDITPRVRATRELQFAKEVAENASRAKSTFLATVSHEIRTPLNGIIGILDFLLTGTLPHELHAHARIARESADGLLATINDVLDFSRIESGRFETAEAPTDLHRLVDDLVALQAPAAAAKGIALSATVHDSIPSRVLTDPLRVRQILQNLISNGIKFTDSGGVRCHLAARPDGPAILIDGSVEDTGIGISREAQERIFREFEQADNSIARRFGGSGLGLAICRSILERLGGCIRVESQPGHGSRFSFHLRARPAPDDTASPSAALEEPPTRPLHILCVDDSPTNQAIARLQLTQLGHAADIVSSGQEAIARLSRSNYDAVLLDIHMPTMDGIQVATIIRDPASPVLDHSAYIVAMTADAMDGDRERFLATGMDDYLSKPVSSQALRAALARAERYSRSRASIPPQKPAGHSPDPLAELWPIFAEEASALIQTMEDALRQGDSNSLAQAAHSLKGSSGSFGFGRLHRLCAGIETEAKASRLDALPEWIRRIRSEFDHLLILRDTPPALSPSHKGTPGHQGDPCKP